MVVDLCQQAGRSAKHDGHLRDGDCVRRSPEKMTSTSRRISVPIDDRKTAARGLRETSQPARALGAETMGSARRRREGDYRGCRQRDGPLPRLGANGQCGRHRRAARAARHPAGAMKVRPAYPPAASLRRANFRTALAIGRFGSNPADPPRDSLARFPSSGSDCPDAGAGRRVLPAKSRHPPVRAERLVNAGSRLWPLQRREATCGPTGD